MTMNVITSDNDGNTVAEQRMELDQNPFTLGSAEPYATEDRVGYIMLKGTDKKLLLCMTIADIMAMKETLNRLEELMY